MPECIVTGEPAGCGKGSRIAVIILGIGVMRMGGTDNIS
ncbi:hypothetical protein C7S13_1275 [Burkholderia cepacia]|nr:hypothetical protein [Burkholderia cepacia]